MPGTPDQQRFFLLLVPALIGAQGYPFSQRASVEQDVAFTQISITYGRAMPV